MSSLYSRLSFFRFLDFFSSFSSGLPTSLLKLFLAKLRFSRWLELLIIGIAPSLLRSFSDILRTLKFSFWERATPMHSPPSVPKSLSLIASDYMVWLRINRAAIQTAPWMPSEFFRMELSTTPRSSYLRVVLLIKSSKKSSSPSPLIMFDARLRDVRPDELMIFLMACMP